MRQLTVVVRATHTFFFAHLLTIPRSTIAASTISLFWRLRVRRLRVRRSPVSTFTLIRRFPVSTNSLFGRSRLRRLSCFDDCGFDDYPFWRLRVRRFPVPTIAGSTISLKVKTISLRSGNLCYCWNFRFNIKNKYPLPFICLENCSTKYQSKQH